MKIQTKTTAVLCTLVLALAGSVPGEGTNDDSLSLFGITVTKKTSEADKLFEYGTAYYTGDGAEKNTKKAMEYFQKAAALGHAQAQFNLAMCYMDTENEAHNETQAAKWFKKAYESGIGEALYPLGICYYNLEQYKEAYAWALLAEARGDTRLKSMFDTMFTDEEKNAGEIRYQEIMKHKQEADAKKAAAEKKAAKEQE